MATVTASSTYWMLALSPCLLIISEAFARALLTCASERAAGCSIPRVPPVPTPQSGFVTPQVKFTSWLAQVSPPVAISETPEAWSVLAALTSQKRAGTQTYPWRIV